MTIRRLRRRRLRRCRARNRVGKVMLGETDLEIFRQRFSEEAPRPFLNDDVRVLPRLVLIRLNPDLAIHLKSKEIRTRELRIVRILTGPCGQRFVGEADAREQSGIRRVGACADQVIAERVVDTQIAELHAAEVFVSRRRVFQHAVDVLLPLRDLGRRFGSGLLRRSRFGSRFGRRCCDRRRRNRTGDGQSDCSSRNRERCAIQRRSFLAA